MRILRVLPLFASVSGLALAQAPLFDISGQANQQLGHGISPVDDMDGGGGPDLVVGAPKWDGATTADAGKMYVFSGANGSLLKTVTGATAGDRVGWHACNAGDKSEDGKPDFAIGASGFSTGPNPKAGVVFIYSGANFNQIRSYIGVGAAEKLGTSLDFLGNSIAGVKDFDMDGRGDILVASFGYDNGPAIFAGKVDVFSVQIGVSLASWIGYAVIEGMGARVASVGDLNGDGATDVAGASTAGSTYASSGGYLRLFLGNAPAPTEYCTPKANSQGCTSYILVTGTATMSLGVGMGVTAANRLPGQNGMMIWSVTSASTPFFGGTLCLGGPINRTAVQSAVNIGGTNPCQGAYQFLVDQSFMTSEGLSAGMNFFLQFWSRDNGFSAPNNLGLTGGIQAKIAP